MSTPVTFQTFGGLDTFHDPSEVGSQGAIALSNVDIPTDGRLKSRYGYTAFKTGLSAPRNVTGFMNSSDPQLIVSDTTTLRAYNSGAVQITSVATSADATAFAYVGTPASTRADLYIANGVDTVRKWSGSAFSTPAYTGTTPTGKLLAVTPWDNRLISGAPAATPYRLLFSDPGVPTTFGANNYIDLRPGADRGPEFGLTALVTWREYVFAFKQSEFFVFNSTSTAGDGNPIFNYRPVSTGIGVLAWNGKGAVAADDGVYFLGERGVYRTTGDAPQKISEPIESYFTDPATWYTYNASLEFYEGALYVNLTGDAGTVMLRFYRGNWTVYTLPDLAATTAMGVVRGLGEVSGFTVPELIFCGPSAVYRYGPAYTTDNGAAISSSYQSGWYDFDSPDAKRLRETMIDGTGTVSYAMASDYGSLGTSASVTLGTSPAVTRGRDRRSVRGRQFSYRISGTGQWSVNRLTQRMADARDGR